MKNLINKIGKNFILPLVVGGLFISGTSKSGIYDHLKDLTKLEGEVVDSSYNYVHSVEVEDYIYGIDYNLLDESITLKKDSVCSRDEGTKIVSLYEYYDEAGDGLNKKGNDEYTPFFIKDCSFSSDEKLKISEILKERRSELSQQYIKDIKEILKKEEVPGY